MGHRSRDEVRSFWRMAIELQQDSGLSIAEFCRREAVHPSSFYAWRRKLARNEMVGDEAAGSLGNASRPAVQFAPVQIVEDREAGNATEHESVEVVASNGLVLRVPSRASSDNVRRVLQLICDVS